MTDNPRLRHWLKIGFLLGVLAISSGYRFRCWWMCTDQTSIQNDYVEQRDRCREYAQLKANMVRTPSADEDKSHRSQMVSLFSECMAKNGWTVPTEGGGKAAAAPAPALAQGMPTPSPAAASMNAARERASLTRSAECAFARQSASVSVNAAARAKACDLECANRLKAAPEAPRPAACPTDSLPNLAKGRERVEE